MAASSLLLLLSALAAEPDYVYQRAGHEADVETAVKGGVVLMGGGKDVAEAFAWMMERSGGGDFLVLRAAGTPAYNAFVLQQGHANSAATLILKTREASSDPFVLARIRQAEAIFLAGGDQWNYIRQWKDTPLSKLLQERIAQGVPIGGTSAGLAVLGQHYFAAGHDTVTSAEALSDPFHLKVTLGQDFLKVPHLEGLITDSHFMARKREGRLVAFITRLNARGLGIDEATAVLLQPDGQSRVVGTNSAHFYSPSAEKYVCVAGKPLEVTGIRVLRVKAGDAFDFVTWTGTGVPATVGAKAGATMIPGSL